MKQRDPDNPIVTDDEFSRARPAREVLPVAMLDDVANRRVRGPQRRPTKQAISIRIDRHTLAAYRATGRGWQGRMGADLERAAKRLKRRRPAHA
jgi:uncharacterized protein (DUF4415 family)